MSSPFAPTNSADSAARSNSHLATQLYWLTGLAPIATNVVTPLMVFWQMRRASKSLMVKFNQQVNEVGRQFVSGTIGLISYFGGGEVTRGGLKALNGIGVQIGKPTRSQDGSTEDDSGQKVAMLLGGILMSFIGFAVIRPLLGTSLICKFLKEEGVEAALTKAQLDDIETKAKTTVERQRLITQKLAEITKEKVGGGQQEGFPIRQVQQWVDKHLFEQTEKGEAKPLLAKTAGVATVALTAWLTGLTGILYGLNQALGGPKSAESLELPGSVGVKPFAQSNMLSSMRAPSHFSARQPLVSSGGTTSAAMPYSAYSAYPQLGTAYSVPTPFRV